MEADSRPEPRSGLLYRLVTGAVLAVVRSIYDVRALHAEHVPSSGGVLMLSNHVSYVDALVLAAACPRRMRFVIWDVLYKVWWMHGFLRFAGTVPISPTRAKDAVRSVAEALRAGGLVCLFPEGQITRHGMVNELRKGYELMARQGGAKVQPVWLDGLYGSVFSFQGGYFFKKRPTRLRYPVKVLFGEPLEAKVANASTVRDAMLRLASRAMMLRPEWLPDAARANALGLRDTEWYQPGDVLWCLESSDSQMGRTVHDFAHLMPGVKIIAEAKEARGAPVVAFCSVQSLNRLTGQERLVFCWDGDVEKISALADGRLLRGYLDASTGLLVSTEVTTPEITPGEDVLQRGQKLGSLGRLLPGFSPDALPSTLMLDAEGFVQVRKASSE